jgi:hypothetical protein
VENPAHGATVTGTSRADILKHEVAAWKSMRPVDRFGFCQMPRREAVLIWMDAMSEGPFWKAPAEVRLSVTREVLRRGC